MSPLSGIESLTGAVYVYDGDGTMVKSIINGVSTYYAGRHYNLEVNGENSVAQKTYAFGSQTIAVRTDGILKWVLADHLGSTSITANEEGSINSEIRYSAFGEVRFSSGTTPTEYQYTNQLNQSDIGLYYYVARFYDPAIAHFVQADTIVPGAGNPAAYDRYSYVLNNPILLNDPNGHNPCSDDPSIPCALRPGERAPYQSKTNPIKYSIVYIPTQPSSFLPPVKNPKVSGGYNYGDITGKNINTGEYFTHWGQDINPPPSEIQASGYGIIAFSRQCRLENCVDLFGKDNGDDWEANLGFGNVLVVEYAYYLLSEDAQQKVDHGNSTYILYAHMVAPSSLQTGDAVKPGEILGTIGSTGWSSGLHLHTETRQGPPGSMTGQEFTPPSKNYQNGITWYGEFKLLSRMDPNTFWAIEK